MRRDVARAVGASLSHARAYLRNELALANAAFELRAERLRVERDEAFAQRDEAMRIVRELSAAILARNEAHDQLVAYHRERAIARARAAERGDSPLQ